MNCTKCDHEIKTKDDSLKCRGLCSHHFHLTLITALIGIGNLLWFCDDCLPNITDTFSSHGNATHPHTSHNQTNHAVHSNDSRSLEDLVLYPNDSSQPQHINNDQSSHAPTQLGETLENLVVLNSTSSVNSVYHDGPVQMDTGDNETESMDDSAIISDRKRRRVSTNDDDSTTKSSASTAPAARKFSSTNYRCIYLTRFEPSTNECHIKNYATLKKNRDATEIMDCKKLLPEKCNMNKITFVSFKLTMHKEFYDI